MKSTNPAAKKSKKNNEAGTDQVEIAAIPGKKFENRFGNNICYINSVLNGLLALDKYREKLNDGSCECPLCSFLVSTDLDAINLRTWASQFNPVFSVHGRQEDAEEFLRVLIDKCVNLSNLAHFDTQEKHTCTVCGKVSHVSTELNRDIKSCQIENKVLHENTADMVNRTQPLDKLCTYKSMNAEGTGVRHTVIDCYTRLPVVLIVSANRFNENRVKISKRVYPSPILEIGEVTYYLKAVVKHRGDLNGGLDSGHYTTALNMETLWIVCDDSKEFSITDETPIDGYLFFYEKSPLNVSSELLEKISTEFAIQREMKNDFYIPKSPRENFSSFKKDSLTSNKNDTCKKFYSSEKISENETDLDPEDVPVNVNYSRDEVIEKLQNLNVSVAKQLSTLRLNKTLESKLKENHPIHQHLKRLKSDDLKDIASKINIQYNRRHDRLCATIARYFFSAHSCSPLTSLKRCMSAPVVESEQMKKDQSIFVFLKSIPDDRIKEYTKKLNKNNLRNFDSMRTFLANFFFDYDKHAPLESLQKFMKDELPELDLSLKKEPNKRKSESRAGQHSKKSKTDSAPVNENQEKLKDKRKALLDSIPKKQGFGQSLIDNPIIDKATRFREIMSNWNREEACKICKESWFDQDNATTGKNIGICQRCRNTKDKEIPIHVRAGRNLMT